MSELENQVLPDAEDKTPAAAETPVSDTLGDMHETLNEAADAVRASDAELAAAAAAAQDAAAGEPAAPQAVEETQAVPSEEPAASKPSPTSAPAAPPTTPRLPVVDPNATDDDRLMAALSWVGMLLLQLPLVNIVLLVAEGNKDRPFQRHHAIQGLGFYVAAIVYELVAVLVFTIGSIVTLGCGALFLWILFFVPHLLAAYYAWQAYQGREVEIPLVSQILRQQNWL